MTDGATPSENRSAAETGTVVRLGMLDLEAHMRDPARKQAFVTPMFDLIAPRYDQFTRLFSFGMDAGWKQSAIRAASRDVSVGNALRVLDLAAGTGDIAIGIARVEARAHVTAVDASANMIAVARARLLARDADVAARVTPMVGDMMLLDVDTASMDVVTAGYGVRNVPRADIALREMRRVLRTGGRVVLLDFYRPEQRVWRALLLWYLRQAGNAVGWWWHREPVVYGYIASSIDHFVSWQCMSAMLVDAGFRVERVERYLGGGVARHEAVAV